MRVRKKQWSRPELEESRFVITSPFEYKGRWNAEFNNSNPIYLELGCGTGKFICDNALNNSDINYIGIDMKDEILVYAKRTVESFINSNSNYFDNIRLIPMNIEFVDEIFYRNEVSRIYINFCNPWPKLRQNKRRLTHNLFLEKYRAFLKPGSEIWFKTDNRELFEDSFGYFKENGFEIIYETYDLHKSDFKNNVMTEYEIKFAEQGLPIMFFIAGLR